MSATPNLPEPRSKQALRPADAAAKLGISLSTLYRYVRQIPTFPRLRKLSDRVSFFYEGELDAYMASPKAASPDGHPAVFPEQGNHQVTGAIGLRDYFAAKAMQAMLVPAMSALGPGESGEGVAETVSEAAYQVAGAMLKARLS